MGKELCSKCVKIIDSNITESTTWYKCYSYVITGIVNVLDGVSLKIENGTKVYILNSDNLPGLIFEEGSGLRSEEWTLGSVNVSDGKYVVVKQDISSNGGLNFYGSNETSDEYLSYNVDVLQTHFNIVKKKSHGKKCDYKIGKLNCVCNFVSFTNISQKDICVNEINIVNNANQYFSYGFGLILQNCDFALNNLSCSFTTNSLSSQTYAQNLTYCTFFDVSNLTINKNLTALGVNTIFFVTSNSKLILEKCCYLNVETSTLTTALQEFNISFTISPQNLYLPNILQSSWNFKGKILDKTTITGTSNNN